MGYGIRLRVWGDYALFCRPEMKVERCSYDVMTPSAARGIVEAIYYHPGMTWHIDRIYVCRPIKFTTIRRNEVKSKILYGNVLTAMQGGKKPLYISTKEDIVQRSALILRDVEYVIEAHFSMNGNANDSDNPGKFKDIVRRRVEQGKCYHTPYLGTREFPARFAPCEEGVIQTAYKGEKDLGFMLYDFDYSDPADIQPMFFRAVMHDGILDTHDCEVMK